jgi:hypothetical protein
MQKQALFTMFIISAMCCLIYAEEAETRGMPTPSLNLIPTAETLGEGGYSLSVGMFPYDTADTKSMDIDVGGFFKEEHHVKLQSDIWLIPTRITYGISERFDLTFGGAYSVGDTEKSVSDYYELGDGKDRVYPQVVLEALLGMKYRIQQASGRLPAAAIGGEFQMGYTVDNEFVDDTLEDSFPFVAMQVYVSASYDFEIVNVHGGLGMFLSSESIRSSQRFELPIRMGIEIPFNGFAAVADFTSFEAFAGVGQGDILSAGLRYDLSSRTTLKVSVATTRGLLARLTVGGELPVITAPPSAPTLF